jgi:hypothetical protein
VLPSFTITDHATAARILKDGSAVDVVGEVDIRGPFDAVVSIVGRTWSSCSDGGPPPGDWDVWNAYPAKKLRLVFDDVPRQSIHGDPPSEKDVEQIILFASEVRGKILLHCGAGISRSGAAALIMITIGMGPGREKEAVDHLLRIRPIARPHEGMVDMADRLLGRESALYVATSERMGAKWP